MNAIEIIAESKVENLKREIARLNRKATKLGTAPLVLTIEDHEPLVLKRHPLTQAPLLNEWVIGQKKAILEYEIPTLDGWELIARLDIVENTVFTLTVPGKEIPEQYQNLEKIDCDHCGHNRRRNHSILIRHTETGEYKQVGSTCVKDFFAGNDPEKFLFASQINFHSICSGLEEDDYYEGGHGGHFYGAKIENVLAYTSAAIKKWGWVSKAKANDTGYRPTADDVAQNIFWPESIKEKEDQITPEDKDYDRAKAALKWWETVEPKNDYLRNCLKLLTLEFIPVKFFGFACSILPTAERELEKAAGEARKAKENKSNHLGNAGDRLKDIKATVIFVREFDGDWGVNVLYTFVDEHGNILKTFYSGSSWEADKGDQVVLDGTVKKHDEFKGEKQTMLNRVKVRKIEA